MANNVCPCCGRPVEAPPECGAELRLSRFQRTLFDRLNKSFGSWVQTETLVDALYADDPNGGPLDASMAVSAVVRDLRLKLRHSDLEIETYMGRGNGGRRLVWKESRMVKATLTGQVQPRVSEFSEIHA